MAASKVPLAVLPGGTANVLAVEIGIGLNMPKAAANLSRLVPARISLGLLQNDTGLRHFVLMAGIGLDAMIVYNIDARMKASFGKVAYWVGGFSQFGRSLPEFQVRVDGKDVQCSFALASRVKNYGGDLWIARNASLYSEHFELVLFQGGHTLPYMKYLLGVLTGRLHKMRGVKVLQTQSLEVCCDADPQIYVQIDGEFSGRLPVRLQIVPDALTLLVPVEFQRRHQNG